MKHSNYCNCDDQSCTNAPAEEPLEPLDNALVEIARLPEPGADGIPHTKLHIHTSHVFHVVPVELDSRVRDTHELANEICMHVIGLNGRGTRRVQADHEISVESVKTARRLKLSGVVDAAVAIQEDGNPVGGTPAEVLAVPREADAAGCDEGTLVAGRLETPAGCFEIHGVSLTFLDGGPNGVRT